MAGMLGPSGQPHPQEIDLPAHPPQQQQPQQQQRPAVFNLAKPRVDRSEAQVLAPTADFQVEYSDDYIQGLEDELTMQEAVFKSLGACNSAVAVRERDVVSNRIQAIRHKLPSTKPIGVQISTLESAVDIRKCARSL